MKKLMCVFGFSILLVCPAMANDGGDQLQAVRVQGFAVVNNLMAYFNPQDGSMDPRYRDRYRVALGKLESLLADEGPKREAFENMKSHISELERNARDTPGYLYPHWVNPMLRGHARLDSLAAEEYQQLPREKTRELLHELNLEISRLLLIYETRTFGTLGVFVIAMEEDTITGLDQKIREGFERIGLREPVHAQALERLKDQYAFIRPRLLEHGKDWVPGITAYYMGNIAEALASLEL